MFGRRMAVRPSTVRPRASAVRSGARLRHVPGHTMRARIRPTFLPPRRVESGIGSLVASRWRPADRSATSGSRPHRGPAAAPCGWWRMLGNDSSAGQPQGSDARVLAGRGRRPGSPGSPALGRAFLKERTAGCREGHPGDRPTTGEHGPSGPRLARRTGGAGRRGYPVRPPRPRPGARWRRARRPTRWARYGLRRRRGRPELRGRAARR